MPVLARRLLSPVWPGELLLGFEPFGDGSGVGLLAAVERTGPQSGRLVAARLGFDDLASWSELLLSASGSPSAVVAPEASAAPVSVVAVWGASVTVRFSHWHARRALRRLARQSGANWAVELVAGCLGSVEAFEGFRDRVCAEVPGSPLAVYLGARSAEWVRQLRGLELAGPSASRSSAPVSQLLDPLVRSLAPRRGRLTDPERAQALVLALLLEHAGLADVDVYEQVVEELSGLR